MSFNGSFFSIVSTITINYTNRYCPSSSYTCTWRNVCYYVRNNPTNMIIIYMGVIIRINLYGSDYVSYSNSSSKNIVDYQHCLLSR